MKKPRKEKLRKEKPRKEREKKDLPQNKGKPRKKGRGEEAEHVKDNTKIFCGKRHLIGRLKRGLRGREAPLIRNMKFERIQRITPGQPTVCQICGFPWAIQGNVRTETGWLPKEPDNGEIERVLPRHMRKSSR